MDVNNTKYHLLYGQDDWGSCLPAGSNQSLTQVWDKSREHPLSDLEWDPERTALRLRREPLLFRRAKPRDPPLAMKDRRGAGRDRYGNWYWIDPDARGVRFLQPGEYSAQHFWSLSDWIATCTPADAQTFRECQVPLPPSVLLRGLAVTTRHYLVVGYLAPDNPSEHGLFLFDLHHGGRPPMQLRWPVATHFSPWDLAPTPSGGVLVLDHDNLTYWALDANFRLLAHVVDGQEALFQPQDDRRTAENVSLPGNEWSPNVSLPGNEGTAPHNKLHADVQLEGYSLATDSPPGPLSPVSIESGPDGRVYILDTDLSQDYSTSKEYVLGKDKASNILPTDPAQVYSTVYEYKGATQVAAYSLKDVLKVHDPDLGEGSRKNLSVSGHDFAYVEQPFLDQQAEGRQQPTRCGCQDGADTAANAPSCQLPVLYVALRDGYQVVAFQVKEGKLVPQEDFFPLRHWGGKALVSADGLAYYDFAERWIPLQVFTECFYHGEAVITTPLTFDDDSPPGTSRSNIPGRPFDSDLPGCVWHRLLLDAHIPRGCDVLVRARAADDPDLLAQMNWLPQPDLYQRSGGAELPFYDPWACDAWVQDPPVRERTGTWEILVQEVKGRYLQLELTIQGTGRSTPALRALRAWYPRFSYADHYLPAIYREEPVSASFVERWLANFEGLYTNLEDKIEQVAELFDPFTAPTEALDWLASWLGLALDPHWKEDRRRFFIRHAMDFYRLRGTLQGVEVAMRLYLDSKLDESLFDLRCVGKSKVRIVERFRTRGIGCQAYDPPDEKGIRKLRPISIQDVTDNAHRFTVLVPYTLAGDQQDIVQRIVSLAKPAHTEFDVQRYWDFFRVGEAQVGLDTRLGDSSQFSALLLGGAYLAESYLEAPYPFDVVDRMVSDRNRLGDLPPL